MSNSPRFAAVLSCLLLLITIGRAFADTNTDVYCQVRPLNLSLTSWANGPLHTNGILAFTEAGEVRVSSQDLIKALTGKPVYTLEKALTNWVTLTIITNPKPIPDEIVTNYFQRAYLVQGPTVFGDFSPKARLFLLEPLSVNSSGVIPIIRDGTSPVDYSISDYFAVENVSFANTPPDAVIRSAKYDTLHGLVDSTEAAIKSFVFDDQTQGQALHKAFQVQGLASEHIATMTFTNALSGAPAGRKMSANVSGIGMVGASNTFTVLRGAVTAGEGKLELK
jgi:hypothetical protein